MIRQRQSVLQLDDQDALERAVELMTIPGPPGKESEVQEYIVRVLRRAAVPESWIRVDDCHRRSPFGGETGNLIVTLPGTAKGPRRLLMAHLDTVPICVGAQPVLRGHYVRNLNSASGLGADNRSGTATILTALIEIMRRELPHPPLTFLWCVQEEVGLYGSRYVDVSLLQKPTMGFNWDGDLPQRVTIGAIGARRYTAVIQGVASHAGVAPERGVNALVVASLAISELHRRGWHGAVRKRDGQGTANIGIVAGGNATNVVMPELRIEGEVRSHDRAFQKKMIAAYKEAFNRAAQAVSNVDGKRARVKFKDHESYRPFRLREDSPVVTIAEEAVRAIGLEPERYVANGGLDANSMALHRIPTVTFGAGQRDVHTTRESMHIPSFLRACRLALYLAVDGRIQERTSS